MFTVFVLRIAMFFARFLPLRFLAGVNAAIWRLGGRFSPRWRVLARNLAAVRAAGGATAGPGDVLAGYGRYWAELVHLAARPSRLAELSLRVEGAEHLDRVAEGRSVCVLSAHLGNWDILSYWLGWRLPGITILVEELRPPALYRLFASIRERSGSRILPADGAGPRLFRRLKRGEHAAIAADRVFGRGTEGGGGVRALPFLGGARRLPSAGLELAGRAGAALLPMFLLREDYGYVIKVYPDLSEVPDPLAAYAACLEAEILARPEQWCVLYPLHDAPGADGTGEEHGAPTGRVKGAAVR